MNDSVVSLTVRRCRRCRDLGYVRRPCPDCGALRVKDREGSVAYMPQLFADVPRVDPKRHRP